jgi:hypothetical protein
MKYELPRLRGAREPRDVMTLARLLAMLDGEDSRGRVCH